MRINVDLGHPAHVHYFRNAIAQWKEHEHDVLVTSRDKDLTLTLLDQYGISHICISKAMGRGRAGLGYELLVRDWRLLRLMRDFRPDILLGVSVSITHVGRLIGRPSVVMNDTEHARAFGILSVPFASCVLTPSCFKSDLGKRHTRFNGYLQLMHTHPNWFTPRSEVFEELGLRANEPFFVVRFVSWESAHDIGHTGFSYAGKLQLVRELEHLGRVIVTSESPVPPGLEPYRMRASPTKIHDLLAFSTLYIGESATMASESALLGTPFVLVSPVRRGYTDEQEKEYGLGYTVRPKQEQRAIQLALELAGHEDLREEWQVKRQRLLKDKIDVTAWLVDFVERYPDGGSSSGN